MSFDDAASVSAHTNFDGEDEPVPTAPPLEILDSVPGYESLGFDAGESPSVTATKYDPDGHSLSELGMGR